MICTIMYLANSLNVYLCMLVVTAARRWVRQFMCTKIVNKRTVDNEIISRLFERKVLEF